MNRRFLSTKTSFKKENKYNYIITFEINLTFDSHLKQHLNPVKQKKKLIEMLAKTYFNENELKKEEKKTIK